MPSEGSFKIWCACGEKLTAPAGSEGKKARCPKCGNTLVVQRPATAPASGGQAVAVKAPVVATKIAPGAPMVARKIPAVTASSGSSTPKTSGAVAVAAPPAEESGNDSFDALYDLADDEITGKPVVEKARCPQCRSVMDDGAVLCIKCGYDVRSGKKLATESVSKTGKAKPFVPGKKEKPVDMMAAQGSVLVGTLLSAAFGLGFAAIWFAVSKAIGRDFPLIGCITGAVCGVGMHLGQKGTSDIGGIIAATLTFLCIVVAKVAVVYAIVYPVAQAFDDEQTFKLVLMWSMLRISSIISVVVGVGVAWRTASGSMSG